MTTHVSDTTKHVVDAASMVTVLGTLVDFLPAVAAAFTIVWTIIRIWETDTIQNFIQKRKSHDPK
jgi:hypothetical protein